jgi:D-alanyl-D-alanine carboxypeptidase/D-alanyl-D-alanine-endopeptidase (penicillin-binding protein 4)
VLWVTVSIVCVLALAGGTVAAARGGLWDRLTGAPAASPAPAFPVPGLRGTPSPVLVPDETAQPSAGSGAALARTLTPLLADRRLGGSVSASVVDAETGEVLFERRRTDPVVPASANKIVTAAAVLSAVGPERRLDTRAVAGTTAGDVVLVGGGDPTLAAGKRTAYPGAARLDLLAAQVKKTTTVRRVVVDGSLFAGPTIGPGWDSDIVRFGFGAPITALTVDGGRPDPRAERRHPTPDLLAGQAFARALGVPVTAVVRGRAPAGAAVLGTVSSPTVLTMVEQMLTRSDNVLAETLARQVAITSGHPASFAGAADAVRETIGKLGLGTTADRPVDASGLSRGNRLTTGLLTSVLTLAARPDQPALRGVLTGLPVAGYSGTLADRYTTAPARSAAGLLRAKTGTLSGVSALTGVLLDPAGRQLAFAFIADGVPPGGNEAAQEALDSIGAALAGCGCR